ncbi:MAG: glycosyltransferase [Bacteriovoracaceae bacterium]|nr:glycosyltransferase [Bacteriovoracaceae bacterium]
MSNLELSVVMPAYNNSALTTHFLSSLLINTVGSSYEVIAIDNGSSDDTKEILLTFKQKFSDIGISFEIQSNPKNVGCGRAHNQGARAARGKYLALASNDTWVMKGWNTSLISQIDKLDLDMACPYNYEKEFDSETIDKIAEDFTRKNKNRTTNEWAAMFMMFKRESFIKLGMLDERFYVTYEDIDLKERFLEAGMKYRLVGSCLIWHKVKGTRGQSSDSSQVEIDGLKIFMDKWGFDPRPRDNTFWAKKIKSFRKFRRKYGYL